MCRTCTEGDNTSNGSIKFVHGAVGFSNPNQRHSNCGITQHAQCHETIVILLMPKMTTIQKQVSYLDTPQRSQLKTI